MRRSGAFLYRHRTAIFVALALVSGLIANNRHYLFEELPEFSGMYTMDDAGREKSTHDSIRLLSHRFIDELKSRLREHDRDLSDSQYAIIESDLTECVTNRMNGQDTKHLDLKQFVAAYYDPCLEALAKRE